MKKSTYKTQQEMNLQETTITINASDQKRFYNLIKKWRRGELSPSGKKYLSTRDLAARLDIDYEQFRKILNFNKPTKKRDCIIAICAALRRSSADTDKALLFYQYMPTLDANNPRDDHLIEILDNQFEHPLTIAEINNRLVRNGFPELDIIDHRRSLRPASQEKDAPYKLIKKKTRTFANELIFGDQYGSLDSEYDLYRYRCIAEMWLGDAKEKKIYHLTAGTRHDYYLETHGKDFLDIKSFKTTDESGIFEDYFFELEGMANHELKKLYATLNDTKNYHTRISAGICNDALHVYAETFNYTVPELEEYYLFEYLDGTPLLSVYRKSEFMRCYLSPDEYASTYGSNSNTLLAQYNSFDELKSDKEAGTNELLLKCRSRYFKQLMEQADSLIADIKAKKRFIRNLDNIYEDRDRVCQYFGVEKEFQCTLDDEEGYFMSAGVDAADFHFKDCGTVHIALKDLYKAFELGFTSINQICRVKKKLGSIEKIIK